MILLGEFIVIHAKIDRIGIVCSGICSLHCLICPIVLALFPIFGATIFANELYERIFLVISAILALSSICFGYAKHRKMFIFSILSAGFFFFAIGQMFEHQTIGLTAMVFGGTINSVAHYINYRLCRSCDTCSH